MNPSPPIPDDDDLLEETFSERLWGLTEMLPESLVDFTTSAVGKTAFGVKKLYEVTCNVSFFVCSSLAILVAPVLFEVERAQLAELQNVKQKNILLGPGNNANGALPGMPPIQ